MSHRIIISNPFSFGGIAMDDAFADRTRELQELEGHVLSSQDVVVFAPRRFGKSSLVWRAAQRLTKKGVRVAYVNLMTTPTKERLAEKLAAAVYESVASRADRARDSLLAPFRGLKVVPQITVDPASGSYSFSFGFGHEPADVDATLERLLELPAELGGEAGERVALVLDEFQEVDEIDSNLPRLMRTIFEQSPEVSRIYLGSKRHMMEEIFSDESQPFWRSAKRVELGPIPAAEFAPFLVDRFGASGKRLPDEIAGRLLDRTGGHPYATQQLAYFLWEETPFDADATEDGLVAAVAAVIRSEHSHFHLRWEEASVAQKLLLGALAREPGRPLTRAYRDRHSLPATATVQTALRALERRELIAKHDGSYAITEPFLTDWLIALDA